MDRNPLPATDATHPGIRVASKTVTIREAMIEVSQRRISVSATVTSIQADDQSDTIFWYELTVGATPNVGDYLAPFRLSGTYNDVMRDIDGLRTWLLAYGMAQTDDVFFRIAHML